MAGITKLAIEHRYSLTEIGFLSAKSNVLRNRPWGRETNCTCADQKEGGAEVTFAVEFREVRGPLSAQTKPRACS